MNIPTSPEWRHAIAGFATYLIAANRAKGTQTTRIYHIRHIATAMRNRSPWDLTLTDLIEWGGAHPAWSTEYRRSYRTSLVMFYRWAAKLGHVTDNPAEGLPAVPPAQPRPHPTPDDMYRAALAKAQPRERLMLRLAAEVGMRRAEVSVVHSSDLIQDMVGWSLLIHGKGDKQRINPLPPTLAAELRKLLPGFAFPGQDHGHLSPRWVGTVISQLLPEGWTMHSLRHRFGTRAYAVDKDMFTVQDLLGHANPATTRAYVKLPDDAKRRLVMLALD